MYYNTQTESVSSLVVHYNFTSGSYFDGVDDIY